MRPCFAGLLLVAACSEPPLSREAQCDAFLAAIEAYAGKTMSESDEPGALMRSAAGVEAAGAAVALVKLEDAALVELRRRYTNMARDLALTSRDAAAAYAGDDEEEKTRVEARLFTSRVVARKIRDDLARACSR